MADDLLRKELVRELVRSKSALNEKEIIDANAEKSAAIQIFADKRLGHW